MKGAGTDASQSEGLLAEAGRLLASSLELDDTLSTVARLAIPELADWCAVDILEPDGALRSLTSGHADPRMDALLRDLRRRYRERQADVAGPGARAVVARDEPATFAPIPPEELLPDTTEEERALWRELSPVSWLIAPMRADDRVLGALSFLSTDAGRVYGEQDFPVVLELADRCAQAVRNAQLYEEAQSSRALLDTVFETAPVGLSLLDAELRYVLANERLADIAGARVPELIGRRMTEAHGQRSAEAEAIAAQVLQTAHAITDQELVSGDRAFLASYAPVVADGRVLGVICAIAETSERHRAQAERDRLLEHTRRLQAVTEELSAALTEAEVADVIFHQGMDATGACCGVLGIVRDGALRIDHRFGISGGAPGLLPLDAQAPMPAAARAGTPVLLGSREEWLARFPDVPPRSDFEAFAAVPLLFEDGVIGVMGIGFPDVRAFETGDVEMLLAIARQGAQALERARLYEERAYVARTLQDGLLPRALPAIEGLDLAVLYRPIADGSEVGGDFYDVVALDDGDGWLVVVGDICGKGAAAAVLTGVMRSTVRALALRESRPAELMRGVNQALLHAGSPQALATMACAAVTPRGEGFDIHVAAGGHPPPLVLRAGGGVEATTARGPMLGIGPEPALLTAQGRLLAGDALLLYTDGIIDARRAGTAPFGEQRLHEALASARGYDATGIVEALDAAVRAHAAGPPRDDKALLALRVR